MNDFSFPLPLPERPDGSRSPSVYLAGAIEKAPDGGVAWRQEFREFLEGELGHQVLDPTAHEMAILTLEEQRHFRSWKTDPTNQDRFESVIRRIIHRDCRLILAEADYIIALWDEAVLGGGGTHGELTLSFLFGIPVFLLLGIPRKEVSSWILGCCEAVFETPDDLKAHLKTLANQGRLGLQSSLRSSRKPDSASSDPPKAD